MSPTIQAVRAMRSGARTVVAGDNPRRQRLIREIETSDYVAEAWTEIGEALIEAAETVTESRFSQR